MSTFIAAISSPAELKKLVMETHRLLLTCVSDMDIEGQITFRCQPEEERSFETRIAMTRTSVSCLALLHWIAAHPVMLGAGCYLAVLHQLHFLLHAMHKVHHAVCKPAAVVSISSAAAG